MKTLIVAEKPSAGKDIGRILGVTESHGDYLESDNYIVTWAVGHLIERKTPDDIDEKYKIWDLNMLPVPTNNGLKVKESAQRQFKVIKELIHRGDVDRIINAGDAGREGLLIQEWIYRMAGNRHPVDILWASSLTDEAIRKAFNNLHSNQEEEFVNLLREAETRSEADQKYGFNYTRMLTKLYAAPGTTLSYGRCQTPLLNLICKRDLKIEKFIPEPYWCIIANYKNGFKGTLIDPETDKALRITSKEKAEEMISVLQEKTGVIDKYVSEVKTQKAPALYNLAELQKTMGKKYGFTPDYTLELAQKLYESRKIMSYPRTDSRYLSDDLFNEIKEHLDSCKFGAFAEFINSIDESMIKKDKSYFNNNKVTDHHALIPTINPEMESIYVELSEDEKRCFDEVIIRFISIFLNEYTYKATEIRVSLEGNIFKSSGTVIEDLGYKKIFSILQGEKEDNTEILPELTEKEKIMINELELKEDKTKPPARISTGNIIALMEKHSIGTSATSAEIVKTLQKRGFIKLEKGKYYATDLGKSFINLIPERLKSSELTKIFEENLEKVNSGILSQKDFLEQIDIQVKEDLNLFRDNSEKVKNQLNNNQDIYTCPICKRPMMKGKTKTGKENYYCTGYKNDPPCSFKIWCEVAGKQITDKQMKELLEKGKTGLIKGFKAHSGKPFNAHLLLTNDGKIEFKFAHKEKRR